MALSEAEDGALAHMCVCLCVCVCVCVFVCVCHESVTVNEMEQWSVCLCFFCVKCQQASVCVCVRARPKEQCVFVSSSTVAVWVFVCLLERTWLVGLLGLVDRIYWYKHCWGFRWINNTFNIIWQPWTFVFLTETVAGNIMVNRGCATEAMCELREDISDVVGPVVVGQVSCCKGNLCNGSGILKSTSSVCLLLVVILPWMLPWNGKTSAKKCGIKK